MTQNVMNYSGNYSSTNSHQKELVSTLFCSYCGELFQRTQHKKQWELQLREDEISQLQQALSDMQVYLASTLL